MGIRAALGEDRPLRREADSRQRRPRPEPAVSQSEGRDDLPLVRPAALRDWGRGDARQARDEGRRGRPHHAENRAPHDGHRRLRHLRGVDARIARRRAARRSLRAQDVRPAAYGSTGRLRRADVPRISTLRPECGGDRLDTKKCVLESAVHGQFLRASVLTSQFDA